MKLHLGCGERFLEGYIHIDLAEFEHIDYKIPVNNLSIFDDNSIDEIYASHVIEYFDRDEVKELLKEWKRVLREGGILRIAVPNFSKLIEIIDSFFENKEYNNIKYLNKSEYVLRPDFINSLRLLIN